MKRLALSVLGSLLVFCMAVVPAWSSPKRLSMATGGTTGIYYSLGGVIAQVLNEQKIAEITIQSTGGTGENLRLINKKDVQIAFSQNDMAYAAFNSIEPFTKKFENLRAIGSTHAEVIHNIVRNDLGLKTLADLKGHKISLGARGSGNEANCRQIFPFYNLTYQNINPVFMPYGESADMFKDRQIDGFIATFPYPHPVMLDITTQQKITYLPIEGKIADEIITKYPYYFKTNIPANTYMGQTADVQTLGVKAMLITHADVPEETIYAITKGLFENLTAISAGHSKGKEISLKTTLEAVTLPLHPGAERYYREKGMIK